MKLREYKFYVDRKISVWQRHEYSVPAKNYEEALEKVIGSFNDGPEHDDSDGYIESSFLFETTEELTPEENGAATKELIFEDFNDKKEWVSETVLDNSIKK